MKKFIRLRMKNKELAWYDFIDEDQAKDASARMPSADDEEILIVEYDLFCKTDFAESMTRIDIEELLDDPPLNR